MPIYDRGQKILTWLFQITASGSYVSGGDTLDLGQLFGTQLVGNSAAIPGMSTSFVSNTPPSSWFVQIQSQPPASGSSATGYVYMFKGGTTLNNCKMQVFQSAAASNPMAELGAGAYPGAITADTILALATVPV
jgi:hypothetical protein